ncbi:MAG: hypothetical protein V3W14_09105 [Candidatus Neomarinimicrobiota bacterium]
MANPKLDKEQLVLAVLATADGGSFEPVQIQKLLFLIDERLSRSLGRKYFHFKPYDYGPFDSAVYRVLERLETQGHVEIYPGDGATRRQYRASNSGKDIGDEYLRSLPGKLDEKIVELSRFVRSLSFSDLISAIYNEFPKMRVNSVFS